MVNKIISIIALKIVSEIERWLGLTTRVKGGDPPSLCFVDIPPPRAGSAHLSEDDVLAVEPGGGLRAEEELGAVGVGARVGHREHPGPGDPARTRARRPVPLRMKGGGEGTPTTLRFSTVLSNPETRHEGTWTEGRAGGNTRVECGEHRTSWVEGPGFKFVFEE